MNFFIAETVSPNFEEEQNYDLNSDDFEIILALNERIVVGEEAEKFTKPIQIVVYDFAKQISHKIKGVKYPAVIRNL